MQYLTVGAGWKQSFRSQLIAKSGFVVTVQVVWLLSLLASRIKRTGPEGEVSRAGACTPTPKFP